MIAAVVMAATLLAAAPADPDVEAGEAAYRAGRFEEAAAAFAKAYARTEDPTYLYTQAQAERKAGHCDVAIELYEEFLGSGPSDEAALAVRDNIAACSKELADRPPADEPAADPTAEPEPAPAPPEPAPKPVGVVDAPARPWQRDPVGWSLVSVGGASMIGGGVLLGLAYRGADHAASASDDRAYGEAIDRAHRLEIAGAVVTSVGTALVVGGIVRLALEARHGRRGAHARIVPIIAF